MSSDSEEVVVAPEKKKYKTLKTSEYKAKVKEFLCRPRSGSSLYEVYFKDGGEIPKVLKGLYTSAVEAQKSIETYKVTRKQYHK
jgi:hypothetical protein